MSKIPGKKMHTALLIALVGLAALASINLTSCTPGSGISASESDVVVTQFDPEIDFGAIKYYAMPDSIFHIVDDEENDKLSRELDAQTLALINSNLQDRGYEPVSVDDVSSADVGVIVRATAIEYWQLYSYYPGYPGWGWGGWYPYYPPYWGGGYAYTTGTLFVDMFDPDTVEENPDGTYSVNVHWQGTINGVLDDSKSSKQQRLTDSINQMFYQSLYLESKE